MACGKTTHESLKDAVDDVRHALIHALENKEEDVVGELYDVYGKLRELVNKNISTGDRYISFSGQNSVTSNAPYNPVAADTVAFDYGALGYGTDQLSFSTAEEGEQWVKDHGGYELSLIHI